ncbi:odorant receptor 13a-like [Chironomus tepperi]|uniref:odorant receptor 13a-like n=1 Tax=Chironomus tepperi TaxID=113505 RepID=UPI00391EEE76
MNNIQSFAPFLWKVFQYDMIHKNPKYSENLSAKIIFALRMIAFGFYIINLLLYFCVLIFNIYYDASDVSKLSFFGIILACLQIALTKLLLIFKNKEKIRKIMQKLPANYSKEEEQDFNVSQQLRWCRVPFLMNLLTTFAGIFISFVTPFDKNIYFNSLKFPLMSNVVVYYFANLWIRTMIIITMSLTIINENIIYGLIIILTVEFRKLKQKIFEIRAKVSENARKVAKLRNILPENRNSNHQFVESMPKIIEIINEHTQLLDIRDDLEDFFAPAFLVNFLCGLICLCTSEILFLVINDPIHGAAFLSSGITQALMFFVQCYYCQQLKDASLSISDAIYDCKWEEIEDVMIKKHLLMILIRSQKSKTLTCWKFAENSFELFGSFLASNYSYFTIFRRLYYKD